MSIVHLEPCPMPKCGGERIEIRKNTDDPDRPVYYSICIKCEVTSLECTSEGSAADAWNAWVINIRHNPSELDMNVLKPVAIAICKACGEKPHYAGEWGHTERWEDYLHVALAAIKAMPQAHNKAKTKKVVDGEHV